MKTFEGTMTITWHKNDYGSCRPITLDFENTQELKKECDRIRNDFMDHGEDAAVAHMFNTKNKIGVPVFSVKIDVRERK